MIALLSIIIEGSIALALYAAVGGMLWTLARLGDPRVREPSVLQLLTWPIVLLLDLLLSRRSGPGR